LGCEGVERELPGAAEQVTGVGADLSSSVYQFDGVKVDAAIESVPVVGKGPRVDHLMGEETAGESER
jgi:hypothetical protein